MHQQTTGTDLPPLQRARQTAAAALRAVAEAAAPPAAGRPPASRRQRRWKSGGCWWGAGRSNAGCRQQCSCKRASAPDRLAGAAQGFNVQWDSREGTAVPAARPPRLHGCRPCWAACLPGGNTKSSCCRSCRGADSPINSSHSPQRRPAPLQHLAERPARLPCSQATVQCIQRRSRRRQRQSSSPDRALDLFSALRGLRGLPLGC